MNDTATHAFFGAPWGDPDPETGLPTVEVNPPIAAALTAAGWHRDPANIEDMYVEGDWVLDNVGTGPIPRAYSIEPSGHHRSVIVHRGPVCDSPVFTINQNSPTPVPAPVVLAAVTALIADDEAEDHLDGLVAGQAPDLIPEPPLGQPCWVTMGGGYGWILAERVEIAGDIHWQELRSLGNRTLDVVAWQPIGERPAHQSRPDVPVVDLADHVDGGRLDPFLLDRAEHDAHAGDTPEPQE